MCLIFIEIILPLRLDNKCRFTSHQLRFCSINFSIDSYSNHNKMPHQKANKYACKRPYGTNWAYNILIELRHNTVNRISVKHIFNYQMVKLISKVSGSIHHVNEPYLTRFILMNVWKTIFKNTPYFYPITTADFARKSCCCYFSLPILNILLPQRVPSISLHQLACS